MPARARAFALLSVALSAATVGCDNTNSSPHNQRPASGPAPVNTTTTPTSPDTTPTITVPAPATRRPGHTVPRRHSRRNQLVAATYRRAKEECGLFSARDLADTYGGDPSDIGSVAEAYAAATTQPGVQVVATQGCLAALAAK